MYTISNGMYLLLLKIKFPPSPKVTEKTIFPFPFKLNGIWWSWWQFFFSILNQMQFHLVQNQKENCHHDLIPFNIKGNGNIVLSVQKLASLGIMGLLFIMPPNLFRPIHYCNMVPRTPIMGELWGASYYSYENRFLLPFKMNGIWSWWHFSLQIEWNMIVVTVFF